DESTAIDIWYHRNSSCPNRGYWYYSKQATGHHALCYSTTPPMDARFWFPCYDRPLDKAEQGVSLNVTVPDSFSVCANGLLDSVTHDSITHTKTFHWNHHYPIATYLVVFAASVWSEYVQFYCPEGSDSVRVHTFCWPEDSANIAYQMRSVPEMLSFYAESLRFGPYPFEIYGHVVTSPFVWGGMENQTMIMLRREQIANALISHEMSHMWWGDMVTCVDFRNVWLNEGFATYADALWYRHERGQRSFQTLMNTRASDYFSEDARHRFATYDPPIEDVYAWGTIYCKGSWIQHMLRYLEHDTISSSPGHFFQALRAYGDSFKYGTANTEDYRRIHEQISGLDLGWFFDEWLYQAGYPQYRLAWSVEPVGENWRLITCLSQNNGNNAPAVFHMPIQLKLCGTSQDSLHILSVSSNPQIDSFILGFRPDSISFDPGRWILKKVQVLSDIARTDVLRPEMEFLSVVPAVTRGRIRVRYWLPSTLVGSELVLFDRAGRRLARQPVPVGRHEVMFDCSAQPAGVYLLKLCAGPVHEVCKMVVSR
ncbi:MAG: M1 family metallopeptidase, partial [candidate division WOR-3 bacterium]